MKNDNRLPSPHSLSLDSRAEARSILGMPSMAFEGSHSQRNPALLVSLKLKGGWTDKSRRVESIGLGKTFSGVPVIFMVDGEDDCYRVLVSEIESIEVRLAR